MSDSHLFEKHADGSIDLNPHLGQWEALYAQERVVAFIGGSQAGKALAVDTLIPTPRGFVAMGDLAVGDLVFAPDGSATEVLYVSPTWYDHECYRLTLDDGTEIVADAEHGWGPDGKVTTQGIAESLGNRWGSPFYLPNPAPFAAPRAELLVPPYTLGAWLGDGFSSGAKIVTMDQGVLDQIAAEGIPIGRSWHGNAGKARVYSLVVDYDDPGHLGVCLEALGVINNKHIPDEYLLAAPEQRMALVRGLMDTDGYAGPGDSQNEFSTSNPRLAKDVAILLRGLGIKVRVKWRKTKCKDSCRITFTTRLPVFGLTRKAERIPTDEPRRDSVGRYVSKAEPVAPVPVRCIAVAHGSHQYLCTESFVPTHNTSMIPWWQALRMVGVPLEDAWDNPQGPEDWYHPALAGGDHLAVAPSVPLLRLKFLPELRLVFEEVLGIGRYWASSGIMELKRPRTWPWLDTMGPHERLADWAAGEFDAVQSNDIMWSRIIVRAAASPRGLESATARTAALDEAGQETYTRTVWEAIRRRLALAEGPILIATTPYVATGWLMEIAERASYLAVAADGKSGAITRVGEPDELVINVPSIVNPSFPPAEFERAKREMSPSRFAMFYLGQFTRPAGLVYPDFDPSTMVIERDPAIDENWRFVGGVDHGWNNPWVGVVLAISPDGVIYLLREEKRSETNTADRGKWMIAEQERYGTRWPWAADPSGKTEIEDLKAMGLHVTEADNSVVPGIDNLTGLIRTGRFKVHNRCEKFLREIAQYTWDTEGDGETAKDKPKKVNDHVMDATRYAAMAATKYQPAASGHSDPQHARPVAKPGSTGPLRATRPGAPSLPKRPGAPARRRGP